MEHIFTQGRRSFRAGFKVQTRWGAREAAAWTFECTGAMLLLTSMFAGEPLAGLAVGVVLVSMAIVLLLLHLGQPRNAWRAVTNLRHSWISRGTLALGGFVVLGGLYVVARLGGASAETIPLTALLWLLVADAAFILAYPGLVMSASPAIPFWNSGLMPLLSLANGAASGLAFFLLIAQWDAPPIAWTASMLWLYVALIGLGVLVLLQVVVMRSRGAAAAASVAWLTKRHAVLFWGGACVIGIAVPLLLAGRLSGGAGFVLIVLCRLAGDYALRTVLLRVGLFSKLM